MVAPASLVRAHIFVSGKVQGVFFRENCRKLADKFKITGWVKNLKDGRVEAVFEGEEGKVKRMVKWAKRGPIWARVDNLEAVWQNYQGEFDNFEIRYDI